VSGRLEPSLDVVGCAADPEVLRASAGSNFPSHPAATVARATARLERASALAPVQTELVLIEFERWMRGAGYSLMAEHTSGQECRKRSMTPTMESAQWNRASKPGQGPPRSSRKRRRRSPWRELLLACLKHRHRSRVSCCSLKSSWPDDWIHLLLVSRGGSAFLLKGSAGDRPGDFVAFGGWIAADAGGFWVVV